MTVKELQAQLEGIDPDYKVTIGYFGSYTIDEPIGVELAPSTKELIIYCDDD